MKTKFYSAASIFLLTLMLLALTIAPVQAQGEADVCGDIYIVQPGDSLSRIANACGVSYAAILSANTQIDNPNLIYPGQAINIPDPNDSNNGGTIPVTGGSIYIVQPGDTLSTIAARFGVSLDDLLAANTGLTRNRPIQPGQQIRLPQGAQRIPTVSVTPATATVGSVVTIAATGFEAGREVVIGFGPVGSEYDEITSVVTDANGALYRSFRITDTAEIGRRYVIVVQRADNPSIRAVSNPLTISNTGQPGIPVTGVNFYIVQPGDSLSEIAARYNTTVEELLELNPEIDSPSIIYTGQRIMLPEGTRPVNPWVGVSDRTVLAGQQLRIRAINFPPNAYVDVRVAPAGEDDWQLILDARTNENGELLSSFTIPEDADAGNWVVYVTTTERAKITRATSQPFRVVE